VGLYNDRSRHRRILVVLGGVCFAVLTVSIGPLKAETLETALKRAYSANPSLNAQRASLRATDETLPRALSTYRPKVNASADIGAQYVDGRSPTSGQFDQRTLPRGAGIQVDQILYNGNRTFNSVRQAESQIFGARETLRNTEQNVLFEGVQVYMNVLRDTAIFDLQSNNIEVLEEQLRQTRDRFTVGEVTRTDVAQGEARLAFSRSQASLAQANLKTSIARFRQVIGVQPKKLSPGRTIEKILPRSLEAALPLALSEHPAIRASMHGVDSADLQITITEGELLPSVTLSGSLSRRYESQQPNDERTVGTVLGRLTVPIYEGGEVAARTRQAKETAGQRRLDVETTRDQVRAAVVAAWGQLESSKAQITAAQAQVQAAEVALNGVREEARVGQRTTLDVLNAQQELLNARVNLITAQRDRVVASYAVLQSLGRLSAERLKLAVASYEPKVHFDQVKDLPLGTQTPTGD
jgi:outer membrane protein